MHAQVIPCEHCDGRLLSILKPEDHCEPCASIGFICLTPELPTHYLVGSQEQIAVLHARYRDGFPLKNPEDNKTLKPLPESAEDYRRGQRRSDADDDWSDEEVSECTYGGAYA